MKALPTESPPQSFPFKQTLLLFFSVRLKFCSPFLSLQLQYSCNHISLSLSSSEIQLTLDLFILVTDSPFWITGRERREGGRTCENCTSNLSICKWQWRRRCTHRWNRGYRCAMCYVLDGSWWLWCLSLFVSWHFLESSNILSQWALLFRRPNLVFLDITSSRAIPRSLFCFWSGETCPLISFGRAFSRWVIFFLFFCWELARKLIGTVLFLFFGLAF